MQINTLQPIVFFPATDLVVVGHDSEAADYDNPRGEIIHTAGYVYAEDRKGYRVRLHVQTGQNETEVLTQCDRLAIALTARLKQGKFPVRFSEWEFCRPCYGSAAYVESNQEEEDYLLERMEEGAF